MDIIINHNNSCFISDIGLFEMEYYTYACLISKRSVQTPNNMQIHVYCFQIILNIIKNSLSFINLFFNLMLI